MNMSVILMAIASLSMIVIGYVSPYITLQFYAIKRKTTIKSLISLLEKYGELSGEISLSKSAGYAMALITPLIVVSALNDSGATYADIVMGLILSLIMFMGILSSLISSGIKNSFDYADDYLSNRPIKV